MTLRIRIVRTPTTPEIDGIRLDSFRLGDEYEVGNALGSLLLAEGWAEPVALNAERPIVPFTANDPYDLRVPYGDGKSSRAPKKAFSTSIPGIAADMSRFKRRRSRRRLS